MMDILRRKRRPEQQQRLVTCLRVTKKQMGVARLLEKAKELNIPRRNCMKTKQELEKTIKDTIVKYKEIIFGVDSPICIKCLDKLWKQQVIDEKVYDQKLMDDAVRKLA